MKILYTAEEVLGRVDWLLGVSPPGKVFTFIKWPKEALEPTLFSKDQILEVSQQGYYLQPLLIISMTMWSFRESREEIMRSYSHFCL